MLKINFVLIMVLMIDVYTKAVAISGNYNWEEFPALTEISEEEAKENVIGLYQFERDEFYQDNFGNLLMYNIFHKKVKITDDEYINSFNKIYISMSDVIEIVEVKARSINPDGTVVNFNKENIKEINDEEGSEGYKIFAIEGIQQGADVEFFYVRKMHYNFLGRSYLQNKFPVKKVRYELICPENYLFEFKVYNHDSTMNVIKEDETSRYFIELNDIKGLNIPRYAYYNPLRIRIEYRLEKDTKGGITANYTWDEAARRVFNMTYELSKKEIKSLTKFIRKELPPVSGSDKEKVLIIEDYLKKNINVQQYGPSQFTDLDYVIKQKITNERGMTKLLANIFEHYNIEHEVLLTVERDNVKFDPDFQTWNYLQDYLIYIKGPDLYLSPANPEFRLGLVPALLTATHGLFIEPVKMLSYESALGKVKYIPPLSYNRNFDNMLIDIEIDEITDKALVGIEMSMNGLSGGYVDEIYKLVEENKKEEFLKGIMNNAIEQGNLIKIEHREKSELTVDDTIEGPRFTIYAEYGSASLLERAGNNYILNIGVTIGEQVEMYQEDERVHDVENNYNRWYYRQINVKVPEGYEIKNPEASNMNIVFKEEGRKVHGFESAFKINGDVYTVIIDEYYKKIFTDKSLFEEFKSVVNAAADFNKVSLILEKK